MADHMTMIVPLTLTLESQRWTECFACRDGRADQRGEDEDETTSLEMMKKGRDRTTADDPRDA